MPAPPPPLALLPPVVLNDALGWTRGSTVGGDKVHTDLVIDVSSRKAESSKSILLFIV